MKKELIIKALIANRYSEKQAEGVVTELLNIDKVLVPCLEKWVKDGKESDFEAEGFSLLGLKAKYNMAYPAALLSIDWLLKDPMLAKEVINRGIK